MPLSAGDKLGPYEILELVGKGGMGEVYRARDSRLNRDVAIKTSAAQFSERFEREAKAIAALNHPNICHLYDVGPNYLVMEYIEGEAPQGPLPLEEALRVARQICDALEAAHDKGITHRDLKPANIKIKPDGTVKVLDFGLAKVDAGSAVSQSENSPTLSMAATQMGVILGTAGYMSPEQARGKAVDKRADIWAFGVVFYELLMGKRLFQGEDVSHTMAAVIMQEPNLDAVPVQVRKLLQRCLEKDPKKRLRDISGVELLLESGTDGLAHDKDQVASLPHKASRPPWVVAAAGFIAAAAFAGMHFLEAVPQVPVMNSTLLPPDGSDFSFGGGTGVYGNLALSPDGTRIVFAAKAKDGKQQLWVRRLDSSTAQPLPGTENTGAAFWSPDSRWIGFAQGRTLKKIDVQGGPPLVIAELATDFGGGSWSPQGVILVGGRSNSSVALQKVPAAGGKPVPAVGIETGKETGAHKFPWFLPDGKHFLYTAQVDGEIPVRAGSLDEPDKPGKVVAQANSNAVYAHGYLLYLRGNTLMAQPFDAAKLETTGEAMPLAENVPTYSSPSRKAGFTVSATGLLAYTTGASTGVSRLVWKDRQGKVVGNVGEPTGSIASVELSPDQKSAVTSTSNNQYDLWIYDVARGIPTRFTFDPRRDADAIWAPDGKTIYFMSNRKGADNLYRKAANGSGSEELLFEDSLPKLPNAVSPDGKLLLFSSLEEKTGTDLWALPLSQGGKIEPRPFLQTSFNESRGRFSPDGQWVAYQSNESGQPQVYAAPFPGPGGKRQISLNGGTLARWRKDGKELFYVTPEGQLMAAEVAARNGTLEVGQVRELFNGITTGFGLTYDVSADGQKFLVADFGTATNSRPLTLVQNWTASLKK